jgi:uncharacterized protein (DUF2267 family)
MPPDPFQRSLETANVWLKEVARELDTEDRVYALRVLRAFLHTLRDHLTVAEAAQLAAQLPELLRGIYYEGWNPSKAPDRYRRPEEFLRRMAEAANLAGPTEASIAADGVVRALGRYVSEGELDDIRACLPEPLRPLLEPSPA